MKPKTIDIEIERLLGVMRESHPSDEEYSIMANNLKTLYEAKTKESHIEWNIILPIIGQIFVTGMVLNHEHLNVITSRVGTFWRKI